MPRYTVQQGDTLSKIAESFRLASWRRIYDHPENAEFRKRRPNPDLLYPGDVVFVPERQERTETAPTDQRNRYVCRRQKQVLRLAVEDMNAQRLAKQPYELDVDGERSRGTTDGNGMIEREIPVGARKGKLKVSDYRWDLQIGHLNPMEEDTPDGGVSGAQGRLRNLGYPVGPVDGICGPKTEVAVRFFQADENLPVTGQLDDTTRKKLLQVHGI